MASGARKTFFVLASPNLFLSFNQSSTSSSHHRRSTPIVTYGDVTKCNEHFVSSLIKENSRSYDLVVVCVKRVYYSDSNLVLRLFCYQEIL